MVMKGLEVAVRYPTRPLGPSRDLDLLAEEPDAAQHALIGAGFVELQTGHDYSKNSTCPAGMARGSARRRAPSAPKLPALSEAAAARRTVGDGRSERDRHRRLARASASCARIVARRPRMDSHRLGRLGDLIDLAVMLPPDRRVEADALARRWGWERMWGTALAVADALLAGGPPAVALRTWARHLPEVRELSVLENHISRLTAPAFALPPRQAAREVGLAMRDTVARDRDERWSSKLYRSALAARDAFRDSHTTTVASARIRGAGERHGGTERHAGVTDTVTRGLPTRRSHKLPAMGTDSVAWRARRECRYDPSSRHGDDPGERRLAAGRRRGRAAQRRQQRVPQSQ